MQLTPENKAAIDSKTYQELLGHWRFAPAGDPRFEGETGEYWGKRMNELRDRPEGQDEHVRSSKTLGWNR